MPTIATIQTPCQRGKHGNRALEANRKSRRLRGESAGAHQIMGQERPSRQASSASADRCAHSRSDGAPVVRPEGREENVGASRGDGRARKTVSRRALLTRKPIRGRSAAPGREAVEQSHRESLVGESFAEPRGLASTRHDFKRRTPAKRCATRGRHPLDTKVAAFSVRIGSAVRRESVNDLQDQDTKTLGPRPGLRGHHAS